MTIRRRTNLVWGIVALGAALALAAGALGVLPAGAFDLVVRAWPALLVLAGLALLFNRLPFGGLLALIVTVLLAAVIATTAFNGRASQQREDFRQAIAQPLPDAPALLRVRVEALATGIEFVRTLTPAAGVTGEFVGSVENQVEVSFEEFEDRSVTLTLRETQTGGFPTLENVGRGTLRLELPADVPLDIEFNGIDGNVILNLSGLQLERLNVTIVRGDLIVTLPDYEPALSEPETTLGTLAALDGDLIMRIPPAVSARLELDRGGSGIQPVFDETVYNYLVGDVLEARDIVTAETVVRYNLYAPRGGIRVEVPS